MPVNPVPDRKCERIAKIIPIALIFAMAAGAIWLPAAMNSLDTVNHTAIRIAHAVDNAGSSILDAVATRERIPQLTDRMAPTRIASAREIEGTV